MHVCVCLMCVCLAFRVMLNGMTKVATPLLASSSSLGHPISAPRVFLTRNTCYYYVYTSIDGGHLCYGASSTAFRRECSDDSVLSKALLMSAMLMTESWATEVRSCPWPQCVKVVP